MPTYDYECENCGHKFELYQSIMADPEKVCPECQQPNLRRLIGTGGAVVFKGSGFYQTDYRSENYKKSAAADSGGAKSKSSATKESSSPAKESSSSPAASTSSSGDSSAKPASSGGSKSD